MASHDKCTLTTAQQYLLYLRIILTFFTFLWSNLLYGWRQYLAGWPLKRAVFVNLLRSSQLSVQDLRATIPTSGDALSVYCVQNDLRCTPSPVHSEENWPTASVHEIPLDPLLGSRERVLLYFHGGGFVFPIQGTAQPEFALACARAAKVNRVFFLEYTLAPELQYPGQLRQAIACLNYLINDRQFRPSEIILGGDSAGGNLILALLVHLHQRHPEIPPLEGMVGEKFKAAFLMSPWVTIESISASFEERSGKDHMCVSKMQFFLDNWNPKSEPWADPLNAAPHVWADIPIDKVLISAGTWESFEDDICEMADILGKQNENISLVTGEGEVHCQGLIDIAAGLPTADSVKKFVEWMDNI